MNDEIPISKTKRKREMHALQEIGVRLVALSIEQLTELALPENLLDAVLEAKRLRAHEARRRQLQYIGKIMRRVDVVPIQERLAVWQGMSRHHTAWIRLLEHWRERLLESEEALAELARSYPQADLQHLRVLVRNVHRERLANKPPNSFRALFQELRIIIPENSVFIAEDAEKER